MLAEIRHQLRERCGKRPGAALMQRARLKISLAQVEKDIRSPGPLRPRRLGASRHGLLERPGRAHGRNRSAGVPVWAWGRTETDPFCR